VFDAWVEIMEKNPARTKLTSDRRTKINARLNSGEFTVEDLIDAIRGARANPWMMGQNDSGTAYTDIVTILGNDAKAARHLERYRNPAPKGRSQSRNAAFMDELRELAREA
jgi:hypothetical protein